ncbi:elongation factor 1-delta 1-like [Papaver somniferum]|uniref:elongation factor 1-delta 1-like n=1 Tax=Papaver somniferum TaxID=3469 RepID=UPI000E70198C|nr:elongation factor 1-delta 1-like [Papaver somniferum]
MGMEDREDVRGNQLRVRMPQNNVPVGDINLFEKEADCDDVKKGTGVHIATPYPAKKAGKSDKSKQETPKSAATPVACNTCSKYVPAEDDDDDSDVDLFGEETEEEKKAAEERATAVKASDKKIYVTGKSSILLDVNPWDEETDVAKLEETVRNVQMEGLS